MKQIITFAIAWIFCLRVISFGEVAQTPGEEEIVTSSGSPEYSCSEIKNKVTKFTTMRNAGIGLIVGGAVVGGIGIGMVASANGTTYYQYNSETGESGNMAGGFGACFAALGIVAVVGGIVLTCIGNGKASSYKTMQKEQGCGLSMSITPNKFALVYGF